MKIRKRSRMRILLALAGTFVAFILSEAAFRLHGTGFRNQLPANFVSGDSGTVYSYHEQLGWRPTPDASSYQWNAEIHIGKEGIRSNGPLSVTANDGPIVLAVGDSMTFGAEVGDDETWPAILEQLLNSEGNGRDIRVLNGGVPGYGLDQMLLLADELVPKFRPVVFILDFIPDNVNRCSQSVRYGVGKPYFTVVPQGLSLHNVPVPHGQREQIDGFRRIAGYSHLVNSMMGRCFPGYWLKGTQREVRSVNVPADTVAQLLFKRLLEITQQHGLSTIAVFQGQASTTAREVLRYRPDDSGVERFSTAPVTERLPITDYVESLYAPGFLFVNAAEQLAEIARDDPDRFKTFYNTNWSQHMTPKGNRFVANLLLPHVRAALDAAAK